MPRPAGALALVAALVVAVPLLGACGAAPPRAESAATSSTAPVTADDSAASPAGTPSPGSGTVAVGLEPARVSIPALGLDEGLIDLGITEAGDMEVPADYDEVGWFTGGGRPGGRGPLVIAAHVDSPTGPAVFVRLHELVVGDVVEVSDSSGAVFRYAVTEVADYAKSAFPTARVFGATARDELRLITCGGVFDRAAASYTENRVVFAQRL